jgi:hypothetical protein
MHRRTHRIACGLAWLALGCGEPSCDLRRRHDGIDLGDDGPPQSSMQRPIRDAWRVEHEGPLGALDDAGIPRITSIAIGSTLGSQDNFVNRGDVIVEFDPASSDTIRIELRRFTFAADEEEAAEIFEKLELWANRNLDGGPKKPSDVADADRCIGLDADEMPRAWQDACSILLYYNGQSQLARAGADIRVTLPATYRESIEIATADSVIEDSYPNRGNVCIRGLRGSADIELQNGLAFVSVASDAEAPGLAAVRGLEKASAEITVDVPSDLWTSIDAHMQSERDTEGTACPAVVVGLPDVEYDPEHPALSRHVIGDANRPTAAQLGGGYGVQISSAACDPVASVESPPEWDPEEAEPEPESRAGLVVCSGCIADEACDALLPG